MRARLLNAPAFARAIGFALVAIAIVAAALHLRTPLLRVEPTSADISGTADALGEELKRCQLIADQAKDDQTCEAAWAENRRRFFTYASASGPTPVAPVKNTGR